MILYFVLNVVTKNYEEQVEDFHNHDPPPPKKKGRILKEDGTVILVHTQISQLFYLRTTNMKQ